MPPASIPTLNVQWHTGDPVGKVVVPGVTEFAYLPTWLTTGHNLSPLTVPFTAELYRQRDSAFDSLPGFLCDCLPDQWGRRIMAEEFAATGTSATPMKMLAWVGNRGIGALRFQPSYESGGSDWAKVQPLLLTREAQAVLRKEPPEAYVHLRNAGTAGGAFPKATIALLPDGSMLCSGNVAQEVPAVAGARLGILKLDCEDLPTRPSTDGRMEFATLEMARAAGINTAQCKLLVENDSERQRHHLFVERFDVLPGGVRRLHLLTLAGALQTYSLTYRDLLSATKRLTNDRTQVVEAVRRMIFNVRAANADDHGKNHSFVFDAATRLWQLSPAYDLTLNYSLERSFNGLFPATFGMSPRRSQLGELAAEVGILPEEFDRLDREVAAALARWSEFARIARLGASDTERASLLHQRMADSLLAEGKPPSRRRRRIF